MRRSTVKLLVLGGALVLGGTLASCATTDAGTIAQNNTSATVPDGGGSSGEAAPPASALDGGCDASEDDCVTKPITCAEAAWCPIPTGMSNLYALTAVWGSSANDVWAGGSGGTMLHWDGTQWKATLLPSPSSFPIKNTMHAVWGTGPNDVWAASATNVIFHTDGFKSGDAVWTRAPSATEEFSSAPIYAVWGTSPDDLRFAGRSWAVIGEEIEYFNQIQKKVGDAGEPWMPLRGSATIHGLWGASPNDLWIIGDNSSINSWQLGLTLHGTRTGNADFVWTEIDSQAAVVLRGIWGAAGNDIWAVGDKGTIRHIAAGEAQWSVIPSPTTESLHAVWGAASNDVWAVGESGTILHWDGAAWKDSVAAFPVNKKKPHLYGVWGSSANDVWVVGDGIALHHTGGAK